MIQSAGYTAEQGVVVRLDGHGMLMKVSMTGIKLPTSKKEMDRSSSCSREVGWQRAGICTDCWAVKCLEVFDHEGKTGGIAPE